MEERFRIAQPVRDLQEKLRRLSLIDPRAPRLIPDGVFSELTLEAVMIFQRDHGLPVTGIVDETTWDALTREAERADRVLRGPVQISAVPNHRGGPEAGEYDRGLGLAQAMFLALAEIFEEIRAEPADGTNGPGTVENLRWLQRAAGLPVDGKMDQHTWDVLARLYRLFVLRIPREWGKRGGKTVGAAPVKRN